MLSPTDRKLLGALLSRQEETGAAAEVPPERVSEIAAGFPPSADEAAALLASPLAREELVLRRRLHRLQQATAPEREADPSTRDNPASRGISRRLDQIRHPRVHIDYGNAGKPLMRGGPPPSHDGGVVNPFAPLDASALQDVWAEPPRLPIVEPADAGPVGEARADNLLFPPSAAPTREGVKPAATNAGWAGLLSRLWRLLGRQGPAQASGQNTGRADRVPFQLDGPWASLRVEPEPDGASYLLTLRLRPEVPGGPASRAIEVRELHPDGLVWLAGRTDGAGIIRAAWAYAGIEPQDRPFASGLHIDGVEPGRK